MSPVREDDSRGGDQDVGDRGWPVAVLAKPRGRVVDHHGESSKDAADRGYLVSAVRVLLVELLAASEGPRAISEGSWIWLIARCWWPSWIQRALQPLQMAVGYRPKVIVTRADRHSGQRGMRTSQTGGGRSLSRY
jgi:hypothetical protein